MTSLARLRSHPADEQAVVIDIPSDLNPAMAKFQPAILAPELRGYVVLTEHLAAFERFARGAGLHVIDERYHGEGQRTHMPECASCGQPARLTGQPDCCPACGHRWRAAYVKPPEQGETTRDCIACGKRQPGAFAYCAGCGAPMPPDDKPPPRFVTLPRKVLVDPVPLSEAIEETKPLLDPKEPADAR